MSSIMFHFTTDSGCLIYAFSDCRTNLRCFRSGLRRDCDTATFVCVIGLFVFVGGTNMGFTASCLANMPCYLSANQRKDQWRAAQGADTCVQSFGHTRIA